MSCPPTDARDKPVTRPQLSATPHVSVSAGTGTEAGSRDTPTVPGAVTQRRASCDVSSSQRNSRSVDTPQPPDRTRPRPDRDWFSPSQALPDQAYPIADPIQIHFGSRAGEPYPDQTQPQPHRDLFEVRTRAKSRPIPPRTRPKPRPRPRPRPKPRPRPRLKSRPRSSPSMACIGGGSEPGSPTLYDWEVGRGAGGDLRSTPPGRWRSLEALDEDREAAAPLLSPRHHSLEDAARLERESVELGFLQSIAALFSTEQRKSLKRLYPLWRRMDGWGREWAVGRGRGVAGEGRSR